MSAERPDDPPARAVAESCPGCGLATSRGGGPVPEEHVASAGCFALYGHLLARGYADPEYYRVAHQVVVDAYATQHAGGTSRRQVQTVGLCLMTLRLFLDNGVHPAEGPALHKRMVARRPDFTRLAPPDTRGLMTVADVLTARSASEHARHALEWGAQVWRAWAPHHATIATWNAHALASTGTRRRP